MRFYWVLLGFIRFYWLLLDFTWFYWGLLSIAGLGGLSCWSASPLRTIDSHQCKRIRKAATHPLTRPVSGVGCVWSSKKTGEMSLLPCFLFRVWCFCCCCCCFSQFASVQSRRFQFNPWNRPWNGVTTESLGGRKKVGLFIIPHRSAAAAVWEQKKMIFWWRKISFKEKKRWFEFVYSRHFHNSRRSRERGPRKEDDKYWKRKKRYSRQTHTHTRSGTLATILETIQ